MARRREQLAELNRRVTETDLRINRLYDAIEVGLADLDDEGLKERMASLKAIRDQAKAEAERLQMTPYSSGNHTTTVDMLNSLSSGSKRAAIGGISFAPRHSASRSLTTKFASWDRSLNCCERLWLLLAGKRRR